MRPFSRRVGLVQRVLPIYRAPFFDALGQACEGGLGIFTGLPRPGEMIKTTTDLEHADVYHGKNLHLFGGKFYLCAQIGLMDWLMGWNPDVLIVEANPRYLKTTTAIRWMQQRDRPVIGWGLGAPPVDGLLADIRRQRRKDFINNFDALITYSQSGAAEYKALGFPEDRLFVAVNAVTPAAQHPIPQRPDPETIDKPRILFVGRLQARKNIDNLLRACAQLPEHQQPEVVIVGDGPAREEWENLAGEIFPDAHFTGALYGEALAAEFRRADLFVLPGTGGLAIQQAMSYGLPVIAAEADGTQADLVRPENGWQVASDDIPVLRAALTEALADLAALREMGAESYRIVAEEINLEQMVEVFIKAIHRSLA